MIEQRLILSDDTAAETDNVLFIIYRDRFYVDEAKKLRDILDWFIERQESKGATDADAT
jgi:hypothetical protein